MELPDLSSPSRGGCLPHRGGRDRPAILVQAMDGGLSMDWEIRIALGVCGVAMVAIVVWATAAIMATGECSDRGGRPILANNVIVCLKPEALQ